MYNVTVRRVPGKAVSIMYSEPVCAALGIQHEKRTCRIVLLSVACPALQCCIALSHKRRDLRKKY